MSKRLFVLFSAVLVASMILTACGPKTPPATTVPGGDQPPAAYECTDAIGCVDIAPGDPILTMSH